MRMASILLVIEHYNLETLQQLHRHFVAFGLPIWVIVIRADLGLGFRVCQCSGFRVHRVQGTPRFRVHQVILQSTSSNQDYSCIGSYPRSP